MRVGGAPATASPALSCSDAARLEVLLSSAVGAVLGDRGNSHEGHGGDVGGSLR
jgi:hypothetical protein